MPKCIIALLLFSSIAFAETIQYRATAPARGDVWQFGYTTDVQPTTILVDEFPVTWDVRYSVDADNELWKLDCITIADPRIGSAVGGCADTLGAPSTKDREGYIPAGWTATDAVAHFIPGIGTHGMGRMLIGDAVINDDFDKNGGFVLTSDGIAFSHPATASRHGSAFIYDESFENELYPIESWSADKDYFYAVSFRSRSAWEFAGVTLGEFSDPELLSVPSSRRLRRNCRFAGLSGCGADGLAELSVAAVPEPSGIAIVLAAISLVSTLRASRRPLWPRP